MAMWVNEEVSLAQDLIKMMLEGDEDFEKGIKAVYKLENM